MKKIVIFSSEGGRGHVSVAEALTEYLSADYKIVTTSLFQTILGNVDPLYILSWGKISGEDIYNWLIQRKCYRTINLYYRIAVTFYALTGNRSKKLIVNYLQEQKPDIIISVIPLVNDIIESAAEELAIPFLLIPTDLDNATFFNGIHTKSYEKFHIALPFAEQSILDTARPLKIPSKNIHITGFPVRLSFLSASASKEAIISMFDLPLNKPRIFIMLGGMGSDSMVTMIEALFTIHQPAHLIICLGKNRTIGKKIDKLACPEHITFSKIGFTNQIASLMAAADICITKSGSVSVCEALYTNVPIILDAIGPVLKWERLNHTFITEKKFGFSVSTLKELAEAVSRLLTDEKLYNSMVAHLRNYHKEDPSKTIPLLVGKITEN